MRLGPESAFVYRVDPGSRLALARMTGRLSGEDMLAIVETVHEDPDWESDFDAIWDCSRVSAHIVLPTDVGPILRETIEGQTGRDVLVESRSLGESLFSKMLALTARVRGKEAHSCHTLADALAVLDRTELPPALDLAPPKATEREREQAS
ncbi:hypothetical protein [Rubrivirga sp.]|uniref:hypothetical protein n=1 Tax=Rubrivirga sp. TaxID=1885344 RepID=UPI003B518FA3